MKGWSVPDTSGTWRSLIINTKWRMSRYKSVLWTWHPKGFNWISSINQLLRHPETIVSDFTRVEHDILKDSIDCEGRSLQINSHGANSRSDLGSKFGLWGVLNEGSDREKSIDCEGSSLEINSKWRVIDSRDVGRGSIDSRDVGRGMVFRNQFKQKLVL